MLWSRSPFGVSASSSPAPVSRSGMSYANKLSSFEHSFLLRATTAHAPSGSRSLTWPASPPDQTALAGQRHVPDRTVRGRTARYLPRTRSFIAPCATPASVPALQTPPAGSAAKGNRPQAADIFVCLEAASTEIPGRKRPYGFHRCAAEPPSFLLPPLAVPAPWATGEGGSGCDERRSPRLCSTDQDGVALAGNSFFVGRCAAVAGSGSPSTMKSVKKTMCYA